MTPTPKKILGISAYYHDSAAAIVVGGQIIAAAQEERFTRIKHTSDFPYEAVKYCLEASGLSLNELDAVVFYDKPFLKFERLLETYYAFAPKGLLSFLKAIPIWLNEKLFLKKQLRTALKSINDDNKVQVPILFPEHHLSHAASAYYASPFNESAILTIDGVGEWTTASIAYGENKQIKILKSMQFPHSVGLLYSAFTYYLGFTVNSGEYKLMGLAPYGEANADQTKQFIATIKKELIDIKQDGSIWLNQKYFTYASGLRMVNDEQWQKLFGIRKKTEEDTIEQAHCNLALAIQTVTEEIVLKMAATAKAITGSKHLCLAGGVALNCVANGKLIQNNVFDDVYIQPASGDAGGALGAALAVSHMYFDEPRPKQTGSDLMQGTYLGPEYSDKEIETMAKRMKAVFTQKSNDTELFNEIADKIAHGMVIGWFQGRMEFGPRALGNRSIIGDARHPEMQKKLNLKIKYREGFRPFAPSVLAEDCAQYFDLNTSSPYMLLVAPVLESRRLPKPDNYQQMTLWERLYAKRSDIQSVTHLDYSARIQTVHADTNPKYHGLISAFKQKTNYGLVVNTSFNVRGEPVVCTPEDAFRCFMGTEMDVLVLNSFVFYKTDQPDYTNQEKWSRTFKKD
jgi:carbamoyltransferase